MYIKLTNGVPETYSLGQLRHDNPDVSFPSDIANETLLAYGVYPVLQVAQPEHNPLMEEVRQAPPVLVAGIWRQVWEVVSLSAEVQAVNQAQAEKQQLNEEFEPAKLAPALKVLTEKLLSADIAAETLSERDAQAVTILFPKWEVGVAYALGRVMQYNSRLYEVMQAHTSQADWAPDVATTLFRRRYEPAGGIADWVAWDGHSASLYQVGSEVMHNGTHWVSNTPNNSWEPGVFGWDPVVG